MYCRNCGEPLKDDDRVCPSCGTPVEKNVGQNSSYSYGNQSGAHAQGAPNNGPQYYNGGTTQQTYNYSGYEYQTSYDSGSIGWGFLGCCFPLVGLILFLVWKDNKPRSAKSAGIGAIIGVGAIILCYVLLAALGIGLGALGLASGEFDMSELEQYLDDSVDIAIRHFNILF